ncbi:putative uncharacterized zinc finger protein 814 [Eurytemora carolleeae]|uniref:putative uncharacterized zinc finger protein 814 n=1 Tax=Eurytemora carolleeae TaxID=1294199 RepID=UPI000C765B02|nr:putative uncharacterized zinc finger protein 814 [Eurytemora carolleeae]XP_023333988.1 putative uncharacterized zinc finger protein 814 [Eurytemora carolleeae]XP_023334068.1 putative uncharacterized zinc finger protein 814 [Eurytemora carolleeae]|eukprot:XP_023333916.1 putative uncharacterized zinc finger protein 814 [Eurytemora affinis]
MAEEYIYACGKCPRTFKLRDFYEKHEKVHALKKQHTCSVCGFVYGAAKGLEGHMESAHNRERSNPEPALTVTEPAKPMQELPFGLGFHFLQTTGVLAAADQARLAQESASLLQKTHQAMLAQMNKSRANLSGLSLVPLTISATSPSTPISVSPSSRIHDKSKIPSPAGTGTYKIYDDVPKIHDAGDALQNDSGFFRCTICTREFSGLNSLKKHVPIHTRRVQHKCDTCGYVFGKKEYLLDHMRKHTGEISPVCEVCGQTFNKSLKLKEHQKLHKNPGSDKTSSDAVPYRCHICKKCFSSADPLGDHLRGQHSETVYKCDMCDATFGDVRGKNHHMYNEHQLDAFHQKCVWCPVCNQGFTRHYNLKVHMYKSHGKEYLENNFSQEELDSLMRPPPGSNTSKPSPSPRKVDKEELIIQGAPTGILPISPPLTPKQSPGKRLTGDESSILLNSASNTNKVSMKARPGPASRTKHSQYFKEEAENCMLNCEFCEAKFLRKSDLYTHMWEHEETYLDCKMCSDKFLELSDLQHHLALVHGQIESLKDRHPNPRKPGPASRTNAPKENRAQQIINSNIPSHLAAQYPDSSGYPCQQCGKVLMHKQSYVSHMRVIHGDYYGGNKWKGSSVVQLVLGDQDNKKRLQEDQKSQISTALHNITNHPDENPASLIYNDLKLGVACEFCNKVFNDQTSMEEHILTVHPYLKKRIQTFKDSHGLKDSDEPDKKRLRLDYEEVHTLKSRELANNNNFNGLDKGEKQTQPLSLVLPSVLTPPSETSERSFSNEEEIDDERDEYDKKDEEHMVQDREDDVRFEPITEEFLFEGRMIRPSYCVLPFVTDEEVETQTRRNITDYYDPSEEFSEEEEGQMVIDENPVEKERSYTSNFNNNEIKVSAIGQGFADSINICNKEEDTPTHSVRLESTRPFFYPSFSNFPLPFSLSTLLQKKKEIAAILVPRTPQLNQSKLTLEHLSKAAMSIKSQISPTKSDSANTTAVSEYEHQIQNDLWPIDCIKCTALLPNLENFNIHMNDHWSDDKCCPVCGLLINSKRFNFKQHLKIHTGEKPFVCQICSRAFRQKAHMVKHVTTHRSEPRPVGHDLTFQPGVIVQ